MRIHIIGIGGIGVSALAQYYLEKGHQVSGSDLAASEVTDLMQKKGAKVIIEQKAENITNNIDLIVHTSAVKEGNAEYDKAKELGIKIMTYAEGLTELTKEHYTIALSGAHGKSTTTAMAALVLIEAGLDPTVIVGTKLKEFGGSNFRAGKSKYLVLEACEYDSSFLNYSPKIIVVNNVDKEHLDYFKTFANVLKTFKKFIACLPAGRCDGEDCGFLVYNKDDLNAPKLITKKIKAKVFGYSLRQPEAKKIAKILKVPGKHNVLNALGVLAVARYLGIKDQTTFRALSKFSGTWRRFEIIQPKNEKYKNIKIVSDYGHHPNEVKATLQAIREKFPKKKIWCIFQPHQHQRTYYLFNDFVKLFRSAKIDKIIITDIYDVAGREVGQINKQVSAEKLVKKIGKNSVVYLPLDQAQEFVKENMKSGDVLLIMGAGDIYKLADKF